MNIFYADVENVGLKFKPLKSDEFKYIIVYHSDNCEKNVQEFKKIYKDVIVEKVSVEGEQAADMKIYDMIYKNYNEDKNNNHFVLSRDKGFKRFSEISGMPVTTLTVEEYTEGALKYLNHISGGLLKESLDRIEILEKENERMRIEYSENLKIVDEIKKLINIFKEKEIIEVKNIQKEVKKEVEKQSKKQVKKEVKLIDIEKELQIYNKHLGEKNKSLLEEVIVFWKANKEKKASEIEKLDRKKLISNINKIIEILKKKKIKYESLKSLKQVVEVRKGEKIKDWMQRKLI